MPIGDEDITVGCYDDVGRRLKMLRIITANSGGAESHQYMAFWTELDDLYAFGTVFADSRVRDPDIAGAINIQAVRKDEQSRADAAYRLACRRVEQIDRRDVRSIASVDSTTIDCPDLRVRAALDACAGSPGAAARGLGPLVLRRLKRIGKAGNRSALCHGTCAMQRERDR